ncbi:YwiC-like family protein [Dactylosporangium sp. NPDC051484]|uniref:YwiC-like family protein n=1 Tax=Dactylosporangium sp. NPDC051484 TaxID=3154942 RepID=UPI00344C2747
MGETATPATITAGPVWRDRPARDAAAGRRRRFLPPQHGAWAMLTVPYLAGLLAAGYRWPDLPLLGAWLAGYLLSYYVFQAIKSRRPRRYRAQLWLYGGIAVPLAALVVAARPAVLWYAPAYAVLFGLNAWYAARRRERSTLNDLASVAQSCLIVLVVAAVAGRAPAQAIEAFLLCLAYFTGTVFYVKTMIRERGNAAYRRWSIGYHVLALAVAAWLSPWAGVLFAVLLLRAALLPGRGWTPKRVGLVEIAYCASLLACVVFAL